MRNYQITPFAPLVLRAGKPVDANTGNDGLVFPMPSTLAGTLRGAYANQKELDFRKCRKEIESWQCAGPLLAALDNENVIRPLFRKPLDSLYTKSESAENNAELQIHRFTPKALEHKKEGCDLPINTENCLQSVFTEHVIKDKPAPGPAWWRETTMIQWLLGEMPNSDPRCLGYAELPQDVRFHVALNPDTLSAEPGLLFQSTGRDFETLRNKRDKVSDLTSYGWGSERFVLLAKFGQGLDKSMLRLGGEGRLSAIDQLDNAWPTLDPGLLDALNKTTKIRMILATPALFDQGWRPGWLKDDLTGECPTVPGLKLKLCAAVTDRWQPISGWDIQAKKAKAVRRLVPAGSVYWFEIVDQPPIGWVEKLWLSSICDQERDLRDGFGMVLLGVYS